MKMFFHSFQSEWLKRKNSAASWLTITGSLLIPIIVLIARMTDVDMIYRQTISGQLWEKLFRINWQFMAVFLLPLGVIIATSLVTQLEYKNNAWKQLHTTPQSTTIIFFVKLLVILAMLGQFFILFNIGIYLCGSLPAVILKAVPYPPGPINFILFLKSNAGFFIDCLPIVALQYLLSIRSGNFLLQMGVGIGFFVTAMIALSWKYAYILPYTYCMLDFMGKESAIDQNINLHIWAAGYFIIITCIAYFLYTGRQDRS